MRKEKTKKTEASLRRDPLRRKDLLQASCFLGPSVLGVILFFVLPFLVVIRYSFIKGPANESFAGFTHYIAVLKNKAFLTAAKNTALFTGIAVPLAVVGALLLALLLECRIPAKSQLRTLFLSPLVVPIASVILVWQVLFHQNGAVNELVAFFGGDRIDWLKSDFCKIVIVVLFLWKNLGYFMILFMAALNNIPRTLLEVADVEGASAAHKFFQIKLRYLSPTILFVTILSITNAFKVFREIYLLTGDYPYTGLYMMQHFMNNMFRELDYQRLSAAAVILALVMVVLIAILFAVENRFGKDVEG